MGKRGGDAECKPPFGRTTRGTLRDPHRNLAFPAHAIAEPARLMVGTRRRGRAASGPANGCADLRRLTMRDAARAGGIESNEICYNSRCRHSYLGSVSPANFRPRPWPPNKVSAGT